MNEAASKRLRLRFFAEDERAVDEALAATTHSSKSNVIRAALAFYESVWASLREGFRVVYAGDGEADWADIMSSIDVSKGPKSGKSHTETSIEIRITPADHDRIQGLLAREAADTSSEVVRRAVRLYAAVAEKKKAGCDILAVSPSGDMLHMPVPGMGVSARETVALRPAPLARPAAVAAQPGSLNDLLPLSLARSVAELAEKEQCPPQVLLIDLVRSETLARLHGFKRETPAQLHPPAPAAPEPIAVETVVPEAAVPAIVTIVKEDTERSDRMAKEISTVFDGIEEQVDNLMRIFGETAHSDGQQELTDLLFAAGLVDNGTAAAMAQDTAALFSPSAKDMSGAAGEHKPSLPGILARATDLRERITALVSIAAMAAKKSKSRARKSQPAEDSPAI